LEPAAMLTDATVDCSVVSSTSDYSSEHLYNSICCW